MFKVSTDDDVPGIVELVNRVYRSAGASADWRGEGQYIAGDRTTVDRLRADLLARPRSSLLKWVLPSGDTILGCVWLEPLGDGTWYMSMLAANADRRIAGLGTTLLLAAEEWAAVHGASTIRMSVLNVRDGLIAWYVRRGYQVTGTTEPFPYGDDRFGIPLRDDLSFLVLEKQLGG